MNIVDIVSVLVLGNDIFVELKIDNALPLSQKAVDYFSKKYLHDLNAVKGFSAEIYGKKVSIIIVVDPTRIDYDHDSMMIALAISAIVADIAHMIEKKHERTLKRKIDEWLSRPLIDEEKLYAE